MCGYGVWKRGWEETLPLGRLLVAVAVLGGIAWVAAASRAWSAAIVFGGGTILLVLWWIVTRGGRRR